MRLKTLIIATAFSLSLASPPAFSQFYFDVGIAPPPARVEVVPPPRQGYLWSPGYWSYEHGNHIWVDGYWVENRAGYAWIPEHWEHHGNKWHLQKGNWRHEHHGHGRGR